jgi:hypothetical protein
MSKNNKAQRNCSLRMNDDTIKKLRLAISLSGLLGAKFMEILVDNIVVNQDSFEILPYKWNFKR